MRTIHFIAFVILASITVLPLTGQTATNFTVTSCAGSTHELFDDLNKGKTVVIIWVMPCSICINGALTAQTEVQNALNQFPGYVVFYMADDYGTTNCTTLNDWASNNGITAATIISNKSVSMNPYGSAGMPKIIVVGPDKKVYYNENAPNITSTGIQSAISQGLSITTGIDKTKESEFSNNIYPNPAGNFVNISINNFDVSSIKADVINSLGQKVMELDHEAVYMKKNNEISFNTSHLKNGVYFITVSDSENCIQEKLVISH